jgi:DNA-binding NtrC family response regulator
MANETVLVIGESLSEEEDVLLALAAGGRSLTRANDVEEALKLIEQRLFHVIVVDRDALGDGVAEPLARIAAADADASLVLVSEPGGLPTAEARIRTVGHLFRPLEPASLVMAVETALFQRKLVQENRALKRQLRDLFTFNDWVGASPESQQLRGALSAAALGSGPVLFVGEKGSGRRLAAELVHYNGPEADSPFLPLHPRALPAGELARLLTTVGTAATGPSLATAVPFASGSLYVSDLTSLEPSDQQALADFANRGGSLRLLASAEPSLGELVERGRFPRNLYDCLSRLTIAVSPLRERRADIPLLIDHFLRRFSERANLRRLAVSPKAIEQLTRYHWPGNVAELAQVMERAVSIASAAKLDGTTLPDQLCAPPTVSLPQPTSVKGQSLKELIIDIEKRIIIQTLQSVAGSQKKAAEMLRLKPTTLHEKMKRYKIIPEKVRPAFKSFVISP